MIAPPQIFCNYAPDTRVHPPCLLAAVGKLARAQRHARRPIVDSLGPLATAA